MNEVTWARLSTQANQVRTQLKGSGWKVLLVVVGYEDKKSKPYYSVWWNNTEGHDTRQAIIWDLLLAEHKAQSRAGFSVSCISSGSLSAPHDLSDLVEDYLKEGCSVFCCTQKGEDASSQLVLAPNEEAGVNVDHAFGDMKWRFWETWSEIVHEA